jgi:type II secretory pathway component GspD/PulD (secretin)
MRAQFTALLLILACATAYADITFYSLNHKSPEDIIPNIRPFLQSGETVVAGRNDLILRVNPSNLDDIKALIKKLDQPAHRLIIYVNKDGQFNRQTKGYNVNNKINIGSKSGSQTSYKGNVRIYSTKNHSNDKNNQSIQVLEGHTAHISVGVSEPTTNVHIEQHGSHSHISTNTQFREAVNGFYVTPRLAKDSVILEIAPRYEEPLSNNRTAAKFIRASSVIRGRLNTWIQLTGVDNDANQTSSKILGRHHQTTKQRNSIWVKVVDLDAGSIR